MSRSWYVARALTQTLWYMQAHLADLAHDPTSSHFRVCQRVYNRCQRILFEEPAPAPSQRRGLLRFLPIFEAGRNISPANATSALVGLACIATAAGSPPASMYGGSLALQQARRPRDELRLDDARAADPAVPHVDTFDVHDPPPDVDPAAPAAPAASAAPATPAAPLDATPAVTPSLETVDPLQHVFGEAETDSDVPPAAAAAAPPVPTKGADGATKSAVRAPAAPLAPTSHEFEWQAKQLCAHYGRTEMQFLQALQDISARLQSLPKPARLSALRAELTALNRTLPSEVCFPTWCGGTPAGVAHKERHHRVVRISASEAVVLNSADRVPYLLHVEVLRNDLDFDPNRRYNRALLQQLLGRAHRALEPLLIAQAQRASVSDTEPHPPSPAVSSGSEVDLTEQVLRHDAPPPPADDDDTSYDNTKNDTLDTAAWAHASAGDELTSGFSLEEYAQRMRTAAVMLAQLNKGGAPRPDEGGASDAALTYVAPGDANIIRQRIMDEMSALEEQRMDRMRRGGQTLAHHRNKLAAEDETAVLKAVNKDDPSAAYFRESWTVKRERIRASSPYGSLPGWDLFSVIVKTGADLRQEQFAVQLIQEFRRVWAASRSRCWVHYFRIVVLNEDAGLIETIKDAVSVHSIKKDAYARQMDGQVIASFSLYDHFVQTYGAPHTGTFARARRHFIESLAGYAIVSYLLQLKDRHNGNILVDADGHLIHIDFGFMLGVSPGGVGFEAAPFKFPRDYIEILGGMESEGYEEFRTLMRQGFRDIRKHAERFILLVELMEQGTSPHSPRLAPPVLCAGRRRGRAAARPLPARTHRRAVRRVCRQAHPQCCRQRLYSALRPVPKFYTKYLVEKKNVTPVHSSPSSAASRRSGRAPREWGSWPPQ